MSHNRDLSAVAAQLGFHSSNIGIGTDNPGNKLEVNSGTDNEGIKVVSTDGGSYITVADNSTTGSTRFGAVGDDFKIDVASAERLRIDSSGHVRINTGDLRVGDNTDSNAGSQTISVGSVSSGSGGIGIFANPTNGNSWVQFGDGTSGSSQYRGYMNYQHADDSLRFGTAASERFRITSDGDMGLGTASPTARLDVRRDDTDGKIAEFHQSTGYGIQIRSSESVATIRAEYNQALIFETGTTATERLRITSDGKMGVGTASPNHKLTLHNSGTGTFDALNITSGLTNAVGLQLGINSASNAFFWHTANGGIQFATNNVERMRVTNNGITFNGDTAAANALDDYEEGTSTVSIQHITADTNQVYMTYTKIGSVVCVVGVITITNKTASSSTNGWFHLPFAPSAHNTARPGCDIQMNTINTNVAYLGFYGNNTNCYFMSRSGSYQNGNSLGNGKIGFTATYTTH